MSAENGGPEGISDREYRRRIRAWTLYDWANSAFATTILAAVLPAYYSSVAGATLPSATVATAYWTTTLSISLIIVAALSPILGTIADVMRGKKKLLSIFVGVGVVGTGLLVAVSTGDWVLASLFFIIGRVGFASANVFYDSLLPHVARPADQDSVSARGYAIGYLGGGLLLAVNVVMIQVLGSEQGARLSFLSVAVWWAIFSIPIFRRVPEPPAAAAGPGGGRSVVVASFARLGATLRNLRRYRELFKYLIAFLIYNDGIGTIIGVAVIYGAELGFGTTELVLAILLVQFVGIPFSLVFGRIPGGRDTRRPVYLAFVLFNIIALPIFGIVGSAALPASTAGASPGAYEAVGSAVGEGTFGIESGAISLAGGWTTIPAEEVAEATEGLADALATASPLLFGAGVLALAATWLLVRRPRHLDRTRWGTIGVGATGVLLVLTAALAQLVVLTGSEPIDYAVARDPGSSYTVEYNGRKVELIYSTGPDQGSWPVTVDGSPVLEDGEPLLIDGTSDTVRYGVRTTIDPGTDAVHLLTVGSEGVTSVGEIVILPPVRKSNLSVILGLLLAVEAVGLVLSFLFGRRLLSGPASRMTTKGAIIVALVAYTVVAVWGFFLDAVIEFWFLAWMVAVVQGGSQALSRSLYAAMSPASVSGEFFGFFSVMSKFSSILGPVIFAGAAALFGSSRPAVLSLVVFFIIGIVLLARVNVDEGKRIARAADAELMGGGPDPVT